MTRAVISLSLALALLVGAAPAHADDPPEDKVAIAVDSISPNSISAESDVITVTGTLTNNTDEPLGDIDVIWRYLPEPMTATSDVDRAITAPEDAGKTTVGPAVVADEIEPGEEAEFEVRLPASAISASPEELATVVDLQFAEAPEEEAEEAETDEESAEEDPAEEEPVPFASERLFVPHAAHPREIVDAVVLTAQPARLPSSNYVPEQLEAEIAGRLLETARGADDRTIVLDPAIYDAALQLVERVPAAARFVETIDAAHEEDRVWLLPHGNPNLARIPDAVRTDLPQWMANTMPESLEGAPTVAITPDAEPVKGFDEAATFAEESEHRHLQRHKSDAKPQVITDLAPLDSAVKFPADDAPWTQVADVLAQIDAFPEWRDELAGPVDPTEVQALTLAAHSTDFTAEADAVAFAQRAPITNFDPEDITFNVSPSFVMTERTSRFPVTVSNQTGLPVTLRIAFTSENPQRIDVADTDPFKVGAGESATVLVTPEAQANGATMVHAQLESASGRKLGPEATVEVTATELGRVGWIIIIASGVFVLAGTAWHIRKVRKEQAKESSESGQ